MKILIVDDDPHIVTFISRVAQVEGYTDIETAYSGEQALTQASHTRYHLITLDILMSGASGLDVVTFLRNMNPHAVIAVISAHIPDEISAEINSCVDVMLSKPVDMNKFLHLFKCANQVKQGLEDLQVIGAPRPLVVGVKTQ
jgi:DNA-binding response OmpR family regulator